MFPNSSLLSKETSYLKDDSTKVDVQAVMDNISIVIYTLTVLFGLTGNAMVIWVAGFKLKVNIDSGVWL